MVDYNFDTLSELADKNPEKFEKVREQLINELIENSDFTYRQRLRGLQFRVDMERSLAKSPMGACIRMSRLMIEYYWDEFVPAVTRLRELRWRSINDVEEVKRCKVVNIKRCE